MLDPAVTALVIAAAANPHTTLRRVTAPAMVFCSMQRSIALATQEYFDYRKTMIAADSADATVSRIAAAIGEPARTRMLYCLLDGHARTSTELAMVGQVSPPTASAHLNRLKAEGLITAHVQGRHRYYALQSAHVARALESLSVIAGRAPATFIPSTPTRYRIARSCYDHLAGRIGVELFESLRARRWIRAASSQGANAYELTQDGAAVIVAIGVDIDLARCQRRRFAYGCLDWSERRFHLAGALGAALFQFLLRRRWLERDLNSRALSITSIGRRELRSRFSIQA